MRKIVLFLAAVLCTLSSWSAKPLVVAHRGFWNTQGSAQNSIRSLVKADSIKCWGSEFDIWSTIDGKLFVNHDPTINGVEIQVSKAKDVAAQKLPNGEYIPTLDSYLKQFTTLPNTQVVLEIKEHKDMSQESKAVKQILKKVKKYGLESRTTYITFSLNAMLDLIKQVPANTEVYYLDGELSPKTLKKIHCAGLDYSLKAMRRHPEWFQKAHDLGLKVNVWTVNSEEDMKWCIDNGADYITTNEPELLQKLLK